MSTEPTVFKSRNRVREVGTLGKEGYVSGDYRCELHEPGTCDGVVMVEWDGWGHALPVPVAGIELVERPPLPAPFPQIDSAVRKPGRVDAGTIEALQGTGHFGRIAFVRWADGDADWEYVHALQPALNEPGPFEAIERAGLLDPIADAANRGLDAP